jgi:hypothetical protein
MLIGVREVGITLGKLRWRQTKVRTSVLWLRMAFIDKVIPVLVLIVSEVVYSSHGVVGSSQNRRDEHAEEKCPQRNPFRIFHRAYSSTCFKL